MCERSDVVTDMCEWCCSTVMSWQTDNLSVLSKLLERLVARQLLAHLNSNGLLPRFQSACRAHHSTETAVLNVLRTFFLQKTQEICLPLFCWTYRQPSTRSIMVFFCIDWTPPIRSWDQYNNGFNPTCQTGYSTCESDLLQLQIVDFTNCHTLHFESVLTSWRRQRQSAT